MITVRVSEKRLKGGKNDLRVTSFALTKLMVGDAVILSCAKVNTQLSLKSENHNSDKKGKFR